MRGDVVSRGSDVSHRWAPAGTTMRLAAAHPVGGGATSDTGAVGGASADGEVAASIAAAARRGDPEAFTTIIRTYEPRLRATAYHVLRDSELVDDALQDVFVAAYRALPGFRGDSALGTWLHRITYTTCAQYLRRASRRPGLVEIGLAKGDDATVADHAESVGERDRLREALSALTPEQRIVVLLVDRDGYDYRAAARLLGIPRGTVASRLNGARAQLRVALGLVQDHREEGP